MNKRNISAILLACSLFLIAAGCKKTPPPPPPPPPPPEVKQPAPPKPAISTFVAEPSSIERGQSSTLRWSVSNAAEVSIDQGIGAVQSSGDRRVFPSSTTTYTLTAKGAGGTASSTARVTVTQPPPPPPPPPTPPKRTIVDRLGSEVQDAYFDLRQVLHSRRSRRSGVRKRGLPQQCPAGDVHERRRPSSILDEFNGSVITVEGHCDERGSAEYNLALGDRRATAAKEYLVILGVSESSLRTISYGKERPQCTESNEECWQLNRRAHFSAGQ